MGDSVRLQEMRSSPGKEQNFEGDEERKQEATKPSRRRRRRRTKKRKIFCSFDLLKSQKPEVSIAGKNKQRRACCREEEEEEEEMKERGELRGRLSADWLWRKKKAEKRDTV